MSSNCLDGGNQQFAALGLTFINCRTAIQLIRDWGWIWQGLKISGASVGISLLGQDGVTRGTGSLLVQDSTFTSTTITILMAPPLAGAAQGSTGVTLDNVAFNGVTAAIQDSAGKVWLAGSVGSVDTYTLGDAYFTNSYGNFTYGTTFNTPCPASLTVTGSGLPKQPYFEQFKPQYQSYTTNNIIQMKWFAKGKLLTLLA
jgi:hypothetical protein